MKLRSVIIDDELNSRELLAQMLENYSHEVEIVGTGKDVPTGIEIIRKTNPDLVYLDIEMPGGGGFEILNAFDNISFHVIFVSGYDHYAIKAFRYSALDYLLKPVDLDELREATARAHERKYSSGASISLLRDQLNRSNEELEQIVISDNNKHVIVNLKNIMYLEAHGNYISFHMTDNNRYTVIKSLNHYEEILPSQRFFRIHKSYLINLYAVQSYESGRGGQVVLKDGTKVSIALRRKPMFIKSIKRIWDGNSVS
jgi:two-component system LytT family response regulator